MKTTFQLSQSGVGGQESLEPHQVVQEAGGGEGGGDLPGQLRHNQDSPPAGQLSALDDVGIEMVPAVEDLTAASQEVAEVSCLPSTEQSSSWDLLGRPSGRTESPAGRLYQVEPRAGREISGFAGVNIDPVKI